MIKEKTIFIRDYVEIVTREKTWRGSILESYDKETILLKLDSGYNIGIKEKNILELKVLEKSKNNETRILQFGKNSSLPNVGFVITGGTISSRLDTKTGGVTSTDTEEILNIAPELRNICNITRIEKPFVKFSEDIGPKDWKKLSSTIENLLNDENISGVIVAHGTDTLHYTASALSFMLGKLNKPVAITYSQRSIDRSSTDAHLNLICSAKYAVSDIAELAVIGHENLDDEFCLAMPGTKIRKMHTSRRDAFKIVNSEPLVRISKKEFNILKTFNPRNNSLKIKLDNKFEQRIAAVKITPGQDPKILEWYYQMGYKGIILELFGMGQAPSKESENNWVPTIKRLVDKGVIICGTAQTINGRLNLDVYSNGRDLAKTGIMILTDLPSESAFVKLGWILGHTSWVRDKKIKQKMLENFVGEYDNKSNFNF